MDSAEDGLLKIQALIENLTEKLVGWVESFVVMIPNLIIAILVVLVAFFVSRWAARFAESLLMRLTQNRPISGLMATAARILILVIGVFVALGLLNLDKTVTSLLAGVGVVGLALGFAFQDIAANFMSGLMMALNRPFRTDDQVEIAGHFGRIESVELRATSIETLDGLSLLIPNKDVFQNPIVNYTRTSRRRLEVSVGTAYCDDLEGVERTLHEAAERLSGRDEERDIEVLFSGFGGSSIDADVVVWLQQSDQMSYRRARSELIQRIKSALDEAGYTIPFPIRTLDFGADGVGGQSLDRIGTGAADGASSEKDEG